MSELPKEIQDPEALAKQRFFTLSLIRLAGALFIALGIAIIFKGVWGLSKTAGYLIFANGILDFAIIPVWLARLWKRKDAE